MLSWRAHAPIARAARRARWPSLAQGLSSNNKTLGWSSKRINSKLPRPNNRYSHKRHLVGMLSWRAHTPTARAARRARWPSLAQRLRSNNKTLGWGSKTINSKQPQAASGRDQTMMMPSTLKDFFVIFM
jgi:hypothetical protein